MCMPTTHLPRDFVNILVCGGRCVVGTHEDGTRELVASSDRDRECAPLPETHLRHHHERAQRYVRLLIYLVRIVV